MTGFINIICHKPYCASITFIHVRPIVDIEQDTQCIVDCHSLIRITETTHFTQLFSSSSLENTKQRSLYYRTTNIAKPDLLVYSYIAVRSCKTHTNFSYNKK